MSRLVKRMGLGSGVLAATAAGTMAVTSIGADEGLRLRTYRDIVGIPTVCRGETKGVRMGMTFTKEQCDAMFLRRLDEFGNAVEKCISGTVSDRTFVAFVSLAYNVGTGAFCKSSVARLYNEGKKTEACNAMRAFNKARVGAGELRVVKGLDERRKREEAACLRGLRWW